MPGLRQAQLLVTFGVPPQRITTLKPFKCNRISISSDCCRLLWSRAIPRLHSTLLFSVSLEQRQHLISRIAVLPSECAILYLDHLHCFFCNSTAVPVTGRMGKPRYCGRILFVFDFDCYIVVLQLLPTFPAPVAIP